MAIGTCSGVVRLRDAREGARALWQAPGWAGGPVVWDFREAQLDFSAADVHALAQFILRHQPATPPAATAFVTQRNLDFGLVRMFEVFREDAATAFHVFRDCDEAISWARSFGGGDV